MDHSLQKYTLFMYDKGCTVTIDHTGVTVNQLKASSSLSYLCGVALRVNDVSSLATTTTSIIC